MLVIGAGEVALSRVNHLIQADAKITVIGPEIHPVLLKYHDLGLLEKLEIREFKPTDLTMYEDPKLRKSIQSNIDLDNWFEGSDDLDKFKLDQFSMILTCLPSYELSLKIYKLAVMLSLPVNLADKPSQCDFYFGSVYRQGPLQVMISTNGKSPRLCNRIRTKMIEPMFNELDLDNAVKNLGTMRTRVRNEFCTGESNETIKKRMSWLKSVTDLLSVEEWCKLNEVEIEKILKSFPDLPKKEDIII